MEERLKLKSPNNWIERAGGYISNEGKVYMPHKIILSPMDKASRAIEDYNENTHYQYRSTAVQQISINVRSVETALYRLMANILKVEQGIDVCEHCLRNSSFFGTKIKALRRKNNSRIIHRYDSGNMISPEDFQFAINYYEEIFKLPLMSPIKWDEKKIRYCDKCNERSSE